MTVLLSFLALGGSDAVAQGMEAMKGMEGMASSRHASAQVVDVVRDAADVPPPVGNRPPTTVKVELTAAEVVGELDPATGTTYRYWTFNGKVPGPMIRVREGDTVEVTLHNSPSSHMVHSIDFHAAIGPGGGAAFSQVLPGTEKTFTFQATTPGLFVYHCGTPMIADHIANGMYGLILVEPTNGLSHADREFYVMQSEFYTKDASPDAKTLEYSHDRAMDEHPQFVVFNGQSGSMMFKDALQAFPAIAVQIPERAQKDFLGQVTGGFAVAGEAVAPASNPRLMPEE